VPGTRLLLERRTLRLVRDVDQYAVVPPSQLWPRGHNWVFAVEAEAAVEQAYVGGERGGEVGHDPGAIVGAFPVGEQVGAHALPAVALRGGRVPVRAGRQRDLPAHLRLARRRRVAVAALR
jgi:hypothetical protein